MKIPAQTYINQLNLLREDLSILMSDWLSDASFDVAKNHAEAMLPLIASQIEALQESTTKLNPVNPIMLRSELEKLHSMIPNKNDKPHFSEYIAMLDSLINQE